jgi:hypothetical protein
MIISFGLLGQKVGLVGEAKGQVAAAREKLAERSIGSGS